MQKYYVQHT